MKAELEIECKHPEVIKESLQPDIDENSKFKAEIETEKDKIEVKIEAEDISGLLAGINSYLKLIRTSIEVQEVD